jgi:hypothetical protein
MATKTAAAIKASCPITLVRMVRLLVGALFSLNIRRPKTRSKPGERVDFDGPRCPWFESQAAQTSPSMSLPWNAGLD